MNKQIAIPPKKDQQVEPASFARVVQERLSLAQWLFVGIVAVPTFIAALFYGVIASDRYVSEASFLVRGASSQNSSGGLSGILKSFGFSRADDDTYVVQNFMQSREAVTRVQQRLSLREIFARPGTDWFSRYPYFWRKDTFEALYDYYLTRVKVSYGTSTGITMLQVSAFRPEDAQVLAKTLVELGEDLVNRMNERAQRDAIDHALNELTRAEAKVVNTQAAITTFRNRELIVDPASNSAKALEIVGTLSSELVRLRAQIQETLASSPGNPSLPSFRHRVSALEDQIERERSKLVGNDGALASKMSAYERLVLSREFADRELSLASGALEMARQEARRQRIYIETIAEPNLPDDDTQPRRMRSFITVLVFSLAIFAMVWFFIVGAREQLHG